MIGVLRFGRGYKRRIDKLEKIQLRSEAGPDTKESASADYIEACGIVDAYIHTALHAKSDSVKLIIRKDFMERFEKTTGAIIGLDQYNRELLHQWMQSNAARFLVGHRGDMS